MVANMRKFLIVIFNVLACISIHADNLYYYIETLPKTISSLFSDLSLSDIKK
jgi:hypothetical protein